MSSLYDTQIGAHSDDVSRLDYENIQPYKKLAAVTKQGENLI